jgi:hypothetical protein
MTALAVLLSTSSGAGDYLHWGVIQVSVTNALIILAMVVVFVLALVLPFPKPPRGPDDDGSRP